MKTTLKQKFQHSYLDYILEGAQEAGLDQIKKENIFYRYTNSLLLVYSITLWAGLYDNKDIIKKLSPHEVYVIGREMVADPKTVLETQAPDGVKLWALHMLFNKYDNGSSGLDLLVWEKKFRVFLMLKGYKHFLKYL